MLTLTVIRDSDEWFALASDWDTILARSGSDGFFLTWVWLRTWWDVYGDDYEPLVIVAEDDQGICGLAPLAVRRDGRLELMGTNAAWGEYADLIVPADRGPEVATAVAERLMQLRNKTFPRLAQRILSVRQA